MTLDLNIDQIREWVTEAGNIARRYFGHVKAEWKGAADPVTAADREIEQLLTARLRDTYPDHGIIGEEYGGTDLDREFLWAVDPIDGTRMFVTGMPSWNIAIGLLHERKPVFGLVYIPLYDDWTYTLNGDVVHNGHSIKGRMQHAWEPDSFILARSDARTLFDVQFKRIMTLGSTASHLAYTARGAAVATITHDSYLWDVAAGVALVNAQGGETRFLSGEMMDFARMDLAQIISGIYISGHPDVVQRLIPLISLRDEPITHPVW
ncbi:MAG: hypothetical protein JW966_01780 [Anaerolineae bacterium]|nr:hypothetical protein [Anaerolineae bacterium]